MSADGIDPSSSEADESVNGPHAHRDPV